MDTFTVSDRPTFGPLAPDSEQAFLTKQAEYEAAYRRTGEALVLFDALAHAWWSRQTVPGWLVMAICDALLRHRTDEEAERYEERLRHIMRYLCVRNLRRKHTRDAALDHAVEFLRGERAGAARQTIEGSYDRVRRDLKRKGSESEFYYLVDTYDIGPNA